MYIYRPTNTNTNTTTNNNNMLFYSANIQFNKNLLSALMMGCKKCDYG